MFDELDVWYLCGQCIDLDFLAHVCMREVGFVCALYWAAPVQPLAVWFSYPFGVVLCLVNWTFSTPVCLQCEVSVRFTLLVRGFHYLCAIEEPQEYHHWNHCQTCHCISILICRECFANSVIVQLHLSLLLVWLCAYDLCRSLCECDISYVLLLSALRSDSWSLLTGFSFFCNL